MSIGGSRLNRIFVRDYLDPRPNARILDVGCGPANILDSVPATCSYVGYEPDEKYVEKARTRWGDRGRFVHGLLSRGRESNLDIVMAVGVLHHLTDQQVQDLAGIAFEALVPGGKFVTIDGCFTPNQSAVARKLLEGDRGRFVRDQEGYSKLLKGAFARHESHLRSDLLRIPYTHVINSCVK